MIKAIIFDLWQTLAYRVGPHHHYLKQMLKGTKTKISLKKFIKIFENSVQTKKWNSKYNAYKNLAQNMGLETTTENINYLSGLRDKAELNTKLYSHVIPMLKKLKKQGYKIGLVSNSTFFSIKYIKKTSLLKYIDCTMFSFEYGEIKPSTNGFKKILKKLKSKPSESVMVGDKINDDIIPSKKLGMHAIHFKNYNQLKKDLKKLSIDI